uniref:IPExxxVDY family protein n=1 Tax=Roseihalotalea indica TaxID=2867963 RepID=A0AA49GM40_9BACT|nr:IPExxxVDY family protein [Tunicatimonas sp. TK19036]
MRTSLDISFQYDFVLFGINSPVKEYKLAWLLNQTCICHFKKDQDITLNKDGAATVSFTHYRYQRASQVWRLLENRPSESGLPDIYLMPELSEWNFLLWLHDPGEHISLSQLQQNLKTIPDIESFSQISVDLLANKDNLLF